MIVTNPVGEVLLAAGFTAVGACYLAWALRGLPADALSNGPRLAKARRVVRHLGPSGVFVALMTLGSAWTLVYDAVRLAL